jgi:uncharacterized cupredoxin-like copper-binding protein
MAALKYRFSDYAPQSERFQEDSNMRRNAFLASILTLTLIFVQAACVPRGYIKDPSPWVMAADWSQAETVRVTMSEYVFTPQVLSFTEGRPYVLEIVNLGLENHYFVSEKFFRAVATRKAQVPEVAELKAPHFTALEVYPGERLELHFVAVRQGTYELRCTNQGHTEKGMTGAIRILPKPKTPSGSTN